MILDIKTLRSHKEHVPVVHVRTALSDDLSDFLPVEYLFPKIIKDLALVGVV